MELASARIAVVGLGLMGGSLCLALKDKCAELHGTDIHTRTLRLAEASGIFTSLSISPAEVLPKADLVILAVPVLKILEILTVLPDLHPGNPVVLDLGSTKRQIVAAMDCLPPRFDPLGGHPMCGTEKKGWENASPDLFAGATFAFTALARTSEQARRLAEQLASAVRARPLWLDAPAHDRMTAATSHLPLLVAAALVLATGEQNAPLVGPGFRSTTRVAASSPEIMLDILRTNADLIAPALDQLQTHLAALQAALDGQDWTALASLLDQAAAKQQALAGVRTPARGGGA